MLLLGAWLSASRDLGAHAPPNDRALIDSSPVAGAPMPLGLSLGPALMLASRLRRSRARASIVLGHPARDRRADVFVAARIGLARTMRQNASRNSGAAARAIAMRSFGFGVGMVASSSASGSS